MKLLAVFSGPAIGWFANETTGAIVGFFVGSVFAAGVSRFAVAPRLENVGGFVPIPGAWGRRAPTEAEQRIEARTVSMPGEAQAFIDWQGGDWLAKEAEPWFVVQARRKGHVVERLRIPWQLLRSIEREQSFKRQFVGSGDIDEMPDASCVFVRHVEANGNHRADWIAIDAGGLANLDTAHHDIVARFGVEARTAKLRERERFLQQPPAPDVPIPPLGERTRPVL